MTEKDIKKALQTLVQRKQLEVRNVKGEDEFSLTEDGLEHAEKMIRENEDCQLFLFSLIFNEESEKEGKKHGNQDKYVALKKALDYMNANFNSDFFLVFKKAVEEGQFQGIKLKK